MNVKNLNAFMDFDTVIVITSLERDVIVDNIEGLEDDDRLRLQIIRQVALLILRGFNNTSCSQYLYRVVSSKRYLASQEVKDVKFRYH